MAIIVTAEELALEFKDVLKGTPFDKLVEFSQILIDNFSDNIVSLEEDVVNDTTSYADITGLSFPVISGEKYFFTIYILYTSQASSTGAGWAINGPASPTLMGYLVDQPQTGAVLNLHADTYDNVNAASSGSLVTAGNHSRITGFIQPSVNGTVIARFKSEIGSPSFITAKAGSFLTWRKL